MTDNNYKLTLIFYKSNKAPYTNVIAIFSDQQKKKTTNQSRKQSRLNIRANIWYQIKQLLSRITGVLVKCFKTETRSGA